MFESLETGLDAVFLFCAVIGGTVFVIQTILQFIGFAGAEQGDLDMGLDADLDADAGLSDHGPHDSDSSFRYLSLQTLSTFFMISGLAGLAMHRQSAFPAYMSIGVAVGAGIIAVRIVAYIFQGMFSLQSKGNADMSTAVGTLATVYLQIPKAETGQIEVVVGSRRRICEAVNESNDAIPTGASVRVVRLQVEAIKNIKIDRITVWDPAGGSGDGSATANFLSGLVRSLPPLHDLAGMAGIDLPEYLGQVAEEAAKKGVKKDEKLEG